MEYKTKDFLLQINEGAFTDTTEYGHLSKRQKLDRKFNLSILQHDLMLLDDVAAHRGISRAELLNSMLYNAFVSSLEELPADARAFFAKHADEKVTWNRNTVPWSADLYGRAGREQMERELEEKPHSREYQTVLRAVTERVPARGPLPLSSQTNPSRVLYVSVRPEPKLCAMLELIQIIDRRFLEREIPAELKKIILSSPEFIPLVARTTERILERCKPDAKSVLGQLIARGVIGLEPLEQ